METFIQNNLLTTAIIFFVLFLISAAFNIIIFRQVSEIKKKSQEFFSGKNGSDLEAIISNHAQSIKKIDQDIKKLFENSNRIHNLSFRGIHKFNLKRFNPFKDLGGDQSFALALLDGKNSGIVLSSLHTREGTRIYAKSVQEGVAGKHKLTTEEEEVVQSAMNVKKSVGSQKEPETKAVDPLHKDK